MKYHIRLQDGDILASFKYEHDRDNYIDALREEYPNIGKDFFNAVND